MNNRAEMSFTNILNINAVIFHRIIHDAADCKVRIQTFVNATVD